MHDEIRSELEGYLSGEDASRAFTRHLESCPPCAREVEEMEQISLSLRSFRLFGAEAGADAETDAEPFAPPAGFYARVARKIEAEQRSPVWGLFAPDLEFFRKIVFASLMLLAVLGSYLVSRESDYTTSMSGQSAAEQATLTEHDSTVPHESPADRQHIMVTLAAYEH
jgi:anti-sigma factor RsiW